MDENTNLKVMVEELNCKLQAMEETRKQQELELASLKAQLTGANGKLNTSKNANAVECKVEKDVIESVEGEFVAYEIQDEDIGSSELFDMLAQVKTEVVIEDEEQGTDSVFKTTYSEDAQEIPNLCVICNTTLEWKLTDENCAETLRKSIERARNEVTNLPGPRLVQALLYTCPGCNIAFRLKENCEEHIQQKLCQVLRNYSKDKSVSQPTDTVSEKSTSVADDTPLVETFTNICKPTRPKISKYKKSHLRSTPIICDVCGKQFYHKFQFTIHQNYHLGIKPYACKMCVKTYFTNSQLKKHVSSVHEIPKPSRPKPYICEVCGRAFFVKRHLQNHLSVHSDLKPFSCSNCDQSFKRKENLDRHVLVHHIKPETFICQVCGKRFSETTSLKKHIAYNHQQCYYKCAQCKEEFDSRFLLDEHKSKEHKTFDLNDSIEDDIQTKKDDSIPGFTTKEGFSCLVCRKVFSQRCNLTVHERTHLNLRPSYSCEFCKKTFVEKSYLKRHLKIHQGVKPFVCFICDKKFLFKRLLNRHMLIHQGIKPYSCSLCDKRFYTKSSLKNHELTVHVNETIYL